MNPLDVLWWSLAFALAVLLTTGSLAIGVILIGSAIHTIRARKESHE